MSNENENIGRRGIGGKRALSPDDYGRTLSMLVTATLVEWGGGMRQERTLREAIMASLNEKPALSVPDAMWRAFQGWARVTVAASSDEDIERAYRNGEREVNALVRRLREMKREN